VSDYETLQHSEWECRYHASFISTYRQKVPYGTIRRHLGELLRRLARQEESEIEDGHLMTDQSAAGVSRASPGRMRKKAE